MRRLAAVCLLAMIVPSATAAIPIPTVADVDPMADSQATPRPELPDPTSLQPRRTVALQQQDVPSLDASAEDDLPGERSKEIPRPSQLDDEVPSSPTADGPTSPSTGSRPGRVAAAEPVPTPDGPMAGPPSPTAWTLAGLTVVAAVVVWWLRPDVLDHPKRRHLLRVVRRSPGRSLSDLADRLDVDRSTVRHHVDALADAGLATCQAAGRCRRVYPADTDHDADLVDALDHPVRRHVLRSLLDTRRRRQRSIRDECDVAPSTLTYHVDRLADAGLVRRVPDGRDVLLTLADGVRDRVRQGLG